MGKKNRIKRDREAGRRRPIADRRNKPIAPYQHLTFLNFGGGDIEAMRAKTPAERRRLLRLEIQEAIDRDGKAPPPLGSTRWMYKPTPTNEPGLMCGCLDCEWRGYLEGIVATDADPAGIEAHDTVVAYGCPECGGHLLADNIVLTTPEGGISATHPAGLGLALENLLRQVRSGEVTPEEAVEELRKEPALRRVIQGLEKFPVSAQLVMWIITTVIAVMALTGNDADPASLTPEQVEEVIARVVSEVEAARSEPGLGDVDPPTPSAPGEIQPIEANSTGTTGPPSTPPPG